MIYFFVSFTIAVVMALVFIKTYNHLVVKRNRVENAFSQLDVQIRRRLDLIPTLLVTVNQYAANAQEILATLTAAHHRYLCAQSAEDKMDANKEVAICLGQLCVAMEPYPDFKGCESFRKLKQESSFLEEKIGSARQFYNDTVLLYNNAIGVFPNRIVASIFHFEEKPYLT